MQKKTGVIIRGKLSETLPRIQPVTWLAIGLVEFIGAWQAGNLKYVAACFVITFFVLSFKTTISSAFIEVKRPLLLAIISACFYIILSRGQHVCLFEVKSFVSAACASMAIFPIFKQCIAQDCLTRFLMRSGLPIKILHPFYSVKLFSEILNSQVRNAQELQTMHGQPTHSLQERLRLLSASLSGAFIQTLSREIYAGEAVQTRLRDKDCDKLFLEEEQLSPIDYCSISLAVLAVVFAFSNAVFQC